MAVANRSPFHACQRGHGFIGAVYRSGHISRTKCADLRRTWIFIGHESEIPIPGTSRPTRSPGQAIIMVRTAMATSTCSLIAVSTGGGRLRVRLRQHQSLPLPDTPGRTDQWGSGPGAEFASVRL